MSVGRYYLNDPAAPKPNSPTRMGTNMYLEPGGRLLLEKRWDCEEWGLVGGRLKKGEAYVQGILREVLEETGLSLQEETLEQLRILDDQRIAAYADGTVWRMVIVLFRGILPEGEEPPLRPSRESGDLRFFSREELKDLSVVATHRDLVENWRKETF